VFSVQKQVLKALKVTSQFFTEL